MSNPALTYHTFAPPPSLARYVRFFWNLEGELLPSHVYTHHSMADVCPELIFHYNELFTVLPEDETANYLSFSGVQGQTKHTSRYRISRSFGLFGVYLSPYTLPVLLHLPASELTNEYVHLNDLLGKEGEELEEKMMLATNTQQRIYLVSNFLEGKLRKAAPLLPGMKDAIQQIRQSRGTCKIKELAHHTCLSERQFERNFKHVTGFSPKLFSRIIRFQAVFNQYRTRPHKTLTELAFQCGYYDQSHFIEDFKLFSGHNPKKFFTEKASGLPWV